MAGLSPQRQRYLRSLADELLSQANRVRDLIGSAHWLSDGHHKEYLLVDLLRRHLPIGVLAGRGFVISPTDPAVVSTEQDVLVVDASQEMPVFNQSGMLITFPHTVRAVVSVKTTLDSRTLTDTVAGLNSVRNVAAGHADPRAIWCGGYFFEPGPSAAKSPTKMFDHIREAVADHPVAQPVVPPVHPCPAGPDLCCTARDLAYRLVHGYTSDEGQTELPRLVGYRCGELATALFLSELLDHIAASRGMGDADFTRFADCWEAEVIGDQLLPRDAGG